MSYGSESECATHYTTAPQNGVIYRYPSADEIENQAIISTMKEICSNERKQDSHIMIMGDFNFPEINLESTHINCSQAHPATAFLAATANTFLYHHVSQPTHYRGIQQANILDLIFKNEEEMVNKLNFAEPIAMSDYVVLMWKFECYVPRCCSKTTIIIIIDINRYKLVTFLLC